MTDEELMREAISESLHSVKDDTGTIPKVGAVIVKDGQVLAKGRRQRDTHAEKDALDSVADWTNLIDSTVYTTLEPCTPGVRSEPHNCCTRLLISARVKKVVIGMLDPNQWVCGKGVLELQQHGIEVELFPAHLADEIRAINEQFVRSQQTLGVTFLEPKPEEDVHQGRVKFTIRCITPPQSNIRVIAVRPESWWPQESNIRQIGSDTYEFYCFFGSPGPLTVHVVRASELGEQFLAFYFRTRTQLVEQQEKLKKLGLNEAQLKALKNPWFPVPFTHLPKGLDSQGHITLELLPPALTEPLQVGAQQPTTEPEPKPEG